jgi:hypothetical protein
MTRDKKLKRTIRAQKAAMGTSYSTARTAVLASNEKLPPAEGNVPPSAADGGGTPPVGDGPPPERRGMPEWIERVSLDGLWYEPRYWRDADYLRVSAWRPSEIEEAFSALQRVFPPAFARRVFARRDSGYVGLLSDPWRADVSPLVPLGFDAAHAQLWGHADLWRRLQRRDEFLGARNELALFAALAHAGMPYDPEPFASDGGANPDARIWFDGDPLIVDFKLARQGGRSKESERWQSKLGLLSGADQILAKPPGLIELTELMGVLFSFEEGRAVIRSNIDRLTDDIRTTVFRLAQSTLFPARDVVQAFGGVIARVTVSGPVGSSGGPQCIGPPEFAIEQESQRVLRGCVEDGASQIPKGRRGAIVVDIGPDAVLDDMVEQSRAWLGAEGELYPDVCGVVLVGRRLDRVLDETTHAVPIFRDGTPPTITNPETWTRFERGLRWCETRRREWRRSR